MGSLLWPFRSTSRTRRHPHFLARLLLPTTRLLDLVLSRPATLSSFSEPEVFPCKSVSLLCIREITDRLIRFGLQFAAATGATVIVTSSSDAKLELAKKHGAAHVINYSKHPEWEKEVSKITGGRGVDHVLEVRQALNTISVEDWLIKYCLYRLAVPVPWSAPCSPPSMADMFM